MKKIVSGEELLECMSKSVQLLCDTVKKTLGPIGSNIIIDHSDFSPFITNDGVTIAKSIESEEPIVNTILELTKEASIKTDEKVGDGTTTTLVLLENIFLSGIDLIKNGKKPIVIKYELEAALDNYLKMLEDLKKIPSDRELLNIAINSANDSKIGKNVFEVLEKVKNRNAIFLCDSLEEETSIKYYYGYQLDTMLVSPHFLENSEVAFDNVLVVFADCDIVSTEEIAFAINASLEKNRPLFIVANDYSEEVVNDILTLKFENKIKAVLLKNPEYGENQIKVCEDLSVIAHNNVYTTPSNLNYRHIGHISHIKIDNKKVVFSFETDNDILKYVEKLKSTSNSEKDIFNDKRLAMLSTGLAEISIGGISKTEIREKHMRYEDALWATSVAKNGVVPGSGLAFLQIKEHYRPSTDGENLIWSSLDKPFKNIIENAGLDNKIFEKIKNSDFKILYNVKSENFENIENTTIIDPIDVIKESLKNAVSIASMLLSTSCLIINEYKPHIENLEKEF